jgi:hypothetical protein
VLKTAETKKSANSPQSPRRPYERLGMDVVSESKIFYMPGTRLLRMAKAI